MLRTRHTRGSKSAAEVHSDRMTAAYLRFDENSVSETIEWILKFANRNPKTIGALTATEALKLAYDVRALAGTIGLDWTWRVPHRPLSRRDVATIHADLKAGLQALKTSAEKTAA